MKPRVTVSLGFAAALAAALVGCGGQESADRGGSEPTAPTAQDPDSRAGAPNPAPEAAITAMNTAVAEVDDGTVFDVDWDDDERDPRWQIQVASGQSRAYDVTVSSDGKKVVDSQPDDDEGDDHNPANDDDDDDITHARKAKVAATDIVRTATGVDSGGVDSLDIGELGDDTPVWKIVLDDGDERTEYTFSTDTGEEISRQRADDD